MQQPFRNQACNPHLVRAECPNLIFSCVSILVPDLSATLLSMVNCGGEQHRATRTGCLIYSTPHLCSMRELIPKRDYHNRRLIAFGCSKCEWQIPLRPHSSEELEPSVESVAKDFKSHSCAEYPGIKLRKPSGRVMVPVASSTEKTISQSGLKGRLRFSRSRSDS